MVVLRQMHLLCQETFNKPRLQTKMIWLAREKGVGNVCDGMDYRLNKKSYGEQIKDTLQRITNENTLDIDKKHDSNLSTKMSVLRRHLKGIIIPMQRPAVKLFTI